MRSKSSKASELLSGLAAVVAPVTFAECSHVPGTMPTMSTCTTSHSLHASKMSSVFDGETEAQVK